MKLHLGKQKKFVSFDPLEALASTPAFKSQSALYNEKVGVCPKCGQPMSKAFIAHPADEVFYCDGCRVSSPLPD